MVQWNHIICDYFKNNVLNKLYIDITRYINTIKMQREAKKSNVTSIKKEEEAML